MEQNYKIALPSRLDMESSIVDDSFRQQYEGMDKVSLKSIIPNAQVEFVRSKYGAKYLGLSYPQHKDECKLTLVDSSYEKGSFQWTQVPQGTTVHVDPQNVEQMIGLPAVSGG